MQKKRILLISYFFAPQNTMGSVRPTKLAKYLARMGHEVTVICGTGWDTETDPTLARDLAEMHDVHMIREWNPTRGHAAKAAPAPVAPNAQAAAPAARPGFLRRLLADGYASLRVFADMDFGRRAKREIRKLQGTYDVVLSSYATYSVHHAACYAKRHGKARCWIADFRDEIQNPLKWVERGHARYLKMIRRHADLVTAVSEGVLEMMDLQGDGRVLPNGFDREDLPAELPQRCSDGKLRMVYCGQFGTSRAAMAARDLTPAFAALSELIDEGALGMDELRLVYAGTEGALFQRYAQNCGLESCVEDHGRVSREESIALQCGADALLMASWHTARQRGILTGKLYEYLMMQKPIVCCVSGDEAGSSVGSIIAQGRIGVCYESVNAAQDGPALKAWLRGMIRRHKSGQPLLQDPCFEAVQRFAYPAIVSTLDGWMDELCQTTK